MNRFAMDETMIKGLQDVLVHAILQFAQQENSISFAEKLLHETSVFFDIEYFKDLISKGEWDTAEGYLMKFNNPKDDDEDELMKVTLFMLKRQKFLEALAMNNGEEALNVFESELQVFKDIRRKALENLSNLLKKNPRDSKLVSQARDIKTSRNKLADKAVKLINDNTMFHGKLNVPAMEKSSLLEIVVQGLEWQHSKCINPQDNPEFSSLYVDHSCDQLALVNGQEPLKTKSAAGGKSKGKTAKRKSVARTTTPEKGKSAGKSKEQTTLQLSKKPSAIDRNGKTRRVSKRQRGEEVSDRQLNDNALAQNPQQNGSLADDLPLSVAMSLPCNSCIDSMDFHPLSHTLLLLGSETGDVSLWELRGKKKLAEDSFRIWNVTTSDKVKTADGSSPMINRVKWSPDGGYIAVAYTSCILHIYTYHEDRKLLDFTEIEAHEGNVFDVAFIATDDTELCVATCGDDRTIKVWEAFTGKLRHRFDGFKEPVCSLYPHLFNDHPAIYAADRNGTVTVVSYNDKKCRIRIHLPHKICARLAFSTEDSRLFAGGTNEDSESCIVELGLTERPKIKHTYDGLVSPATDYVCYDIVNGKYLAAIDEFKIKFWEISNTKVLKTVNARIGEECCIKFNRNGTLLAVTTNDNRIKILANEAGKRVLQPKGKSVLDAPSDAVAVMQNDIGFEPMDLFQIWNEINESTQCVSQKIPNAFFRENVQVSCLAYTKSGRAILVLGSNGEHKLWEWEKTAENPTGKATPKSEPKLWQAPEDLQMVNDVGYANPQGRISCFALPKNRHYVLSASGGIVSVYDIMSFKTIAKVMPSPPAATALAIHPNDSNTLVFGMEDSSIQIYQFRTRQVSSMLAGHTKRVTGLAFSDVLNVLVSSGADSQLCIWRVDNWEKLGSTFLKVPRGRASDTRIQFHKDQRYLLAVHKTQIAIYTVPELINVNKWTPPKGSDSLITHAAYSCDCESIFVAFQNGNVGVFTAESLDLKCTISSASFMPPDSSPMPRAFPMAVAAHPTEANQFALGLSDGMVVVLEPSGGTWGMHCPVIDEDEAGPSGAPAVMDLDQLIWLDDDKEV